jgi:hypothetical protein
MDPLVTALLGLRRGDPLPDGTAAAHLRLAVAEARIERDASAQAVEDARLTTLSELYEHTEGGKTLGPNEQARKVAADAAVAADEEYTVLAYRWSEWSARLAHLEAHLANAEDARRLEDRRVREKMADALLVSAGATVGGSLNAALDEAFVGAVATQVMTRIADRLDRTYDNRLGAVANAIRP